MNRTAFQKRQRLSGALLACLLMLAGCAAFPSQPHRLQATGTDSDGGRFDLTVTDPDNIVTDAKSLSRPGGLSDEGVQLDAD